MADIYQGSAKVATIGPDGTVHSYPANVLLGYVKEGEVHDAHMHLLGNFTEEGEITREAMPAGTVHISDGKVFDHDLHLVGKVVGEPAVSAGAALILLFLDHS